MENDSSIPMQEPGGGDESSVSQGYWQEIPAALKLKDYERISDLLRVIATSPRTANETRLIQIALQVCLTCNHCHSEVEWHRRAYKEADARERELQQGLEAILTAIISAKEVREPTVEQGLPRALLSPHSRKQSTLEPKGSLGIWKRIRAFLPFRRKQASGAVHEEQLPLLEERENLLTPPMKEEKLDVATTEVEPVTIDKANRIQEDAPLLAVYCLGAFRVYQDEQAIENWPSNKGKAIFKYLITHRKRPVAKEILMDIFWPDADLDSARNSLNVAIYGLRQTLRNGRSEFSHVLFQNDSYQLNPTLRFWIDYENFMSHLLSAQSLERKEELAKAIVQYTSAEALYDGEFLDEDRYEDWLLPQRQRLQEDYLGLLDRLGRIYYEKHDLINCTHICLKILAVDPCREEAHRQLMRCYHYQGQAYLALRQYHICSESLKRELDAVPSKVTRELYELIRKHGSG